MFKIGGFAAGSYALVAQPDRASDSDSEGRWFESSQARHTAPAAVCSAGVFLCSGKFVRRLKMFCGF